MAIKAQHAARVTNVTTLSKCWSQNYRNDKLEYLQAEKVILLNLG